jgi:putative membrane protein
MLSFVSSIEVDFDNAVRAINLAKQRLSFSMFMCDDASLTRVRATCRNRRHVGSKKACMMNSRMRNALMSTIVATACAAVVPVSVAQDKAASSQDAMQATKASGDATALAVLATVDKDEIAAAKLALTKGMSKGAEDYAHMMVHEHEANLADTRKLKPSGMGHDADAMQVKKDDEATMAKLKPLEGKAFEKAYIDAMVAGHTKVLGKLDNELLPNAIDAKVKAHLKATREAVSKHLDAAKALQG